MPARDPRRRARSSGRLFRPLIQIQAAETYSPAPGSPRPARTPSAFPRGCENPPAPDCTSSTPFRDRQFASAGASKINGRNDGSRSRILLHRFRMRIQLVQNRMLIKARRRNHEHTTAACRAPIEVRQHIVQSADRRRVQLVVDHHRRIEAVLAIRLRTNRPVKAPALLVHDPLLRIDDVTRSRERRIVPDHLRRHAEHEPRLILIRRRADTLPRPASPSARSPYSAIAAASSLLPFFRGSINRHVRYCRCPSRRFLKSCFRILICQGRKLNGCPRERALRMRQPIDKRDRILRGRGCCCGPSSRVGVFRFHPPRRSRRAWITAASGMGALSLSRTTVKGQPKLSPR